MIVLAARLSQIETGLCQREHSSSGKEDWRSSILATRLAKTNNAKLGRMEDDVRGKGREGKVGMQVGWKLC